MAKPCRYQLPGQDTWMSEQEFMQKLNDGLLDKFVSDNNIAVRNFKFTPNQDLASKFRTPVETAPVTETAPIAKPKEETTVEIKNLEKTVQDEVDNQRRRMQYLSPEEYINEDFPLLSYQGQDQLTKNEIDNYNKKSRKINEDGSFSNKYGRSIIEYLSGILPDRKLISAFRKAGLDIPQAYDISSSYRRSMGLSGYIRDNIGLIANGYDILSESEKIQATKILSNVAKDAGIKVATLESEANREVIKPSTISTPTETPKTETAPTPQAETTPTTPKTETVTEAKETPKVETKAQPTLSKKDQEEAKILENDLDYYTRQMEDAQDQIDIEKSNFKEEKERISQEKAKVRLSKMSKDKKADKLEELDAELSDIKDDHDDLIEQYKDDIQEAKSELKRINNRKAKLEQKAKALVAETKAQPTAKPTEEKLSPRAEKMKNNFVDSYNSIPAKNNRQRSSRYQYIAGQQSSLDPEERQAAKAAMSEIYANEKKAAEGVRIPKNKKERQEAADKNKMIYHDLFGAVIESTPEQYEAALKEKAETGSIEDIMKYGKEIPSSQSPTPDSFRPSLLSYSQQDAQDTLDFDKQYKESKPTPKAEPVAPQQETVSKSMEKAGPKTTQGAKVKATTQRGGDLEYTVQSISEDGKTATVQAPDRLKNPNDATQGKISGEVSTLPIEENINGERIVQTNKGTTVYLDRVIAPAETTLFETKKKEEPKEKKDGRGTKKSVTFALNTGRDVTRFTPKITMEKNNRTGQWELIKPDGTKMEASVELQNQAQLEYNKQNGIQEEAKEIQNEAIEETKDNKDIQEVMKSDIGEDASEVSATPTIDQKPKKSKPKNRSEFLASRRRGSSTEFSDFVSKKLKSIFPYIQITNDINEFNRATSAFTSTSKPAAIIKNGIIYLNPNVANNNNAFEEYAHVYLMAMKQVNPDVYNMGIELVKTDGENYINEVMNDPGYADIQNSPDKVAFEALSKMIADRGESILDAKKKKPVVEYLKELWKKIGEFFLGKRKILLTVDTLDTYVDKVARDMSKGSSISNLTSAQLANIQENSSISNKVKINSAAFQRASERAKWFRETFLPDRGVSERTAEEMRSEGRKQIEKFENRTKIVVNELNNGLDQYYKSKKINSRADKIKRLSILQDVDRALIDREFKDNWMSKDPEAERLILPSINKMRMMIDDLQERLVKSGLLSDELDVKLSKNIEEDATEFYINTAYHLHSADVDGNWFDVLSDTEQKIVLDYLSKTKTKPARSVSYKINKSGAVNVTFMNSLGSKTEVINFDSLDDFKKALGQTKRMTPSGALAKSNLKVNELPINTGINKTHSINFNSGLDISSIAEFPNNQGLLIDYVNELKKNKETDNLLFGKSKLTSSEASKALRKKRNINEAQKILLKQIKDPRTNFTRTIAKQSEILFKGNVEQSIIDSGYLSRYGSPSKELTVRVNKPGSRLDGYYISPEMHSFLFEKTPTLSKIVGNGVRSMFGYEPSRETIGSSSLGFFTMGSALTKAYVTVLSPTSNAANYLSGYIQLIETGNLPIGMITSMKAIQEQSFIDNNGRINSQEGMSYVLNTASSVVKALSNILVTETSIMKKGIGPKNTSGMTLLTEDQKKFYGVKNYDELSPRDKSKLLLEELIENNVISSSIDANVIKDLIETSFNNESLDASKSKSKLISFYDAAMKGSKSTLDKASKIYSFSDSMFKTIAYISEKQKNYNTYGSVMKQQGMSNDDIEAEMKRMSSDMIRRQMPTYDRSPGIIQALSRNMFIAPFVQFDLQTKINGVEIISNAVKLAKDGVEMKKKGFNKEGNLNIIRSLTKMGLFSTTLALSEGIKYAIASAVGGFIDDDDDEIIRSLLPEFQEYNSLIHLDSNRSGIHKYVDISRVNSQDVYSRYFRAFSEDGFEKGVLEIIEPYINSDIFASAVLNTIFNVDKYGNKSDDLEDMTFVQKIEYALSERILPSGIVGSIEKLISGARKEEINGVTMNLQNELLNTLLGAKIKQVNINKKVGEALFYNGLDRIENKASKKYNKKLNDFKKTSPNNIYYKEKKEEVERAKIEAEKEANEYLNEAVDYVNRLRDFGLSDDEIRKSLSDVKSCPKYIINRVLSDSPQPIVFDEEGKIKKEKSPKIKRSNEFDMDIDMDLDMDMGIDF